MPQKSKKVAKKSISKKNAQPAYLREVEIKFKKKRVSAKSPLGESITDSNQIYSLFQDLQNEAKEKLIAVSLDSNYKIICFEVIAIGSVKAIYLRPGEAVRSAIALNAHGIILIHNHPAGDPSPSKEDKKFTKDLGIVADALGVNFLDHLIIGDGEYFSFSDEGLLK